MALGTTCAWSADARRRRATATVSDRVYWIAWRPDTRYVATPAGLVPSTTSWGTHYAILHVAPGTSAIVRPLRVRRHPGFMMLSAQRIAALGAAIRRLAIRASIVRTSGLN